MGKEIISYKGFDSSLRCRGFQYEVGKDYEQEGNIKCCENGFHACEFPYDVFSYYAPGENSRYCIVTQSGEMDNNEGDSKVASSKIHIETEIGLDGIIKAGVKFDEVIAIGPGEVVDGKIVPMTVKVGNKVITSKYSGTEVKLDGEEYIIVKEDDILAIVE